MLRIASLVLLHLAVAGCGDDASRAGWTTTVNSTPSGIRHVVNQPPASDDAPPWTLEENLRIGEIDGGGPATFGQLKALVVDSLGRVIVLESQAQEIRVFAADGSHIATYGGKGGGPGEFQNALGIMQTRSGLLYVPDQRNRRISVLSVDSGFVTSYPLNLYRYGFVWNGVMTADDRILVPSMVLETRRDLVRVYSLDMTQIDSVMLPEGPPIDQSDPPGSFAWRSPDGRTSGFTGVPYYPTGAAFLDRTGETWSSRRGDPAYRIARVTLHGDTTLLLETHREPLPVSAAERDSALDVVRENLRQYGVTTLDESKVPSIKPAVLGMFTDDAGNLWVQTSSTHVGRSYDIYEREGRYLGTLATPLRPVAYIRPLVRGDVFYAVVTDEMDVPYVIRARIRKP